MELGPIVLPAVALLCAVVEYAAEQTGTTPDAVLFDLRQRVTEPLYTPCGDGRDTIATRRHTRVRGRRVTGR